MQSAWKTAGALPPDALVPRRKSNSGTNMTYAVTGRYAVQSAAVEGAAEIISKNWKPTLVCSVGCSDLDTLAHAASLADRVADSVRLSRGEAASPALTELDGSFLAAEAEIGLPLHQMDRKERQL